MVVSEFESGLQAVEAETGLEHMRITWGADCMGSTGEDFTGTVAIQYSEDPRGEYPCGICGGECYPETPGPEMFLAGTDKHVCGNCGLKYAPELTKCLTVYYQLSCEREDDGNGWDVSRGTCARCAAVVRVVRRLDHHPLCKSDLSDAEVKRVMGVLQSSGLEVYQRRPVPGMPEDADSIPF